MRIADLFCNAGGASKGYRAAFPHAEIVGVDIRPQPRYPFEFVQADAMTFPLDGFDFIHASPPCQRYSVTRHSHNVEYPDLIGATRAKLEATGRPWVIENVVGAPLRNAHVLCGASFGLTAYDDDGTPLVLKRHRLFETSFAVNPPACACARYKQRGYRVAGVYGGGREDRSKSTRSGSRGGYTPLHHVRAALMGIDWMNGHELAEAIPPVYAAFIGLHVPATATGLAAA